MVWLAIVIGLFLFYKFVDRKDKLVTFKVIAIIAVVIGFGSSIFYGYDKWMSEKEKSRLQIDVLSHSVTDKSKIHLLLPRIEKSILPVARSLFPDLENKSFKYVSMHLLSYYMDESPYDEFRGEITDYDIKRFILQEDWEKNPTKENLNALEKVEIDKLNALRKSLQSRRSIQKSFGDFEISSFLHRLSRFPSTDIAKKEFEKFLSENEKRSIENYKYLKDLALEEFENLFNRSDLKSTISFKVCNRNNKPLISYRVNTSGFQKNRSSARALDNNYGSSTLFESDIIIKPNSCKVITWTGDYNLFNRYEVISFTGIWKE